MLGAIVGDIVGSVHEGRSPGLFEFPLFSERATFTDDTVLTVAVADAILTDKDYGKAIRRWAKRYPTAGYGAAFSNWLAGDDEGPYNSFGNGAAMRVSPVGWAFDLVAAQQAAVRSACATHNHPEGIKGAQAVAAVIWMGLMRRPKQEIDDVINKTYEYDLEGMRKKLMDGHIAASTCQESVPAAMIAFLHSKDFEHALRLAVGFGGDTDTVAAIAGSMAEAYYGGIPLEIEEQALGYLDAPLRKVVDQFRRRYCRKKVQLKVVLNGK